MDRPDEEGSTYITVDFSSLQYQPIQYGGFNDNDTPFGQYTTPVIIYMIKAFSEGHNMCLICLLKSVKKTQTGAQLA